MHLCVDSDTQVRSALPRRLFLLCRRVSRSFSLFSLEISGMCVFFNLIPGLTSYTETGLLDEVTCLLELAEHRSILGTRTLAQSLDSPEDARGKRRGLYQIFALCGKFNQNHPDKQYQIQSDPILTTSDDSQPGTLELDSRSRPSLNSRFTHFLDKRPRMMKKIQEDSVVGGPNGAWYFLFSMDFVLMPFKGHSNGSDKPYE